MSSPRQSLLKGTLTLWRNRQSPLRETLTRREIIFYSAISLLILAAGFLPVQARADYDFDEFLAELEDEMIVNENYTQIINSVSASASTGGNTASEGETVEGKAEASIKVKTIIDGQVVEDIGIKEESKAGDVNVKVESRVQADGGKAVADITTVINNKEKTEKYEVDLGDQTADDPAQREQTADDIDKIDNADSAEKQISASNESHAINADEESAEQANIMVRIWINIFDSLKAGILKILNIFA